MANDTPFQDAARRMVEAAKAALLDAANQIMEESDFLCPKDTETLVESRFIDPVVNDGERVSVKIGYGRGEALNPKDGKPAGAYAVPVHEILSHRHLPPTQAKFLETPCLAYEAKLGDEMRKWISRYERGDEGLVASEERVG